MLRQAAIIGLGVVLAAGPVRAQDRKQKVLEDQKTFGEDPHWVYNDLAKGVSDARRTGKPLLVVLRCIP
jgi:hypothetical protein